MARQGRVGPRVLSDFVWRANRGRLAHRRKRPRLPAPKPRAQPCRWRHRPRYPPTQRARPAAQRKTTAPAGANSRTKGNHRRTRARIDMSLSDESGGPPTVVPRQRRKVKVPELFEACPATRVWTSANAHAGPHHKLTPGDGGGIAMNSATADAAAQATPQPPGLGATQNIAKGHSKPRPRQPRRKKPAPDAPDEAAQVHEQSPPQLDIDNIQVSSDRLRVVAGRHCQKTDATLSVTTRSRGRSQQNWVLLSRGPFKTMDYVCRSAHARV